MKRRRGFPLDLNSLTSTQRKLVYLGAILLLMIPTILLGQPASREEGSGGMLAKMRSEYDLGESTLGDVDPSSETMNLLLLGMRGVAVNVLWQEHEDAKQTKNWAQMKTLANSITILQPHFLNVWEFHGWNLAYNVSVEWDDVRDRYFWVKEGIKFVIAGQERNKTYAELPYAIGHMLGQKLGRADEWRLFRQYFKSDPDPKFEGKPDEQINPNFEDNYLAARRAYLVANERDRLNQRDDGDGKTVKRGRQHKTMPALFYHYPARSLFDYAAALEREGTFGETARAEWENAYKDWTADYGVMRFDDSLGLGQLQHEWTDAECDALAAIEWKKDKFGFKNLADYQAEKRKAWRRLQNVTNYRYWRTRAEFEKTKIMSEAHREMYLGRQAWRDGRNDYEEDPETGELIKPPSMRLLESGMEKFSKVMKTAASPQTVNSQSLVADDTLIEEGLLAVMYWREILEREKRPIPDEYPLKWLWDSHMNNESFRSQMEQEFKRDKKPVISGW